MKSGHLRLLLRPLGRYAGRELLLAVSGGADSVALLRALLAVGARPTVAHLDHALRPESAQDAGFVAALAAGLGVPCVSQRLDVGAVAARQGRNLEETARRVRYSFLTRAAKGAGLHTILTAHTRSDQAETVLWQLLRGEAVLNGIPGRRGQVERPWLGVGRAEILTYLGELGQSWREDASNADRRYTRNWLRHEVIPLLQTRTPGLEGALARLARFQVQDDEALQALASRLTAHAGPARQPLAVLRRFARLQLGSQPVRSDQVEQIAAALQGGGTLHLTLPGSTALTVTDSRIVAPMPPTFPRPEFALPGGWVMRHPLPGDRLTLPGGTRRLSDLLTDLKVPRAHRPLLWLLADDRLAAAVQSVQWVGLPDQPVWALGAAERAGQWPQPDPEWLAMGEALALAARAAEAGEVPVGAVVLRRGEVIAAAANRSRELSDLTRHAELDALRAASAVVGPYLNDCTLVVTLEPCPMCLGAVLEARIGRIVYGAANPRAGALGGVSDLLAQHWGHRPEVRAGLRAREAARLLRGLFEQVRGAAVRRAETGEVSPGLAGDRPSTRP